MDDQLNKRKVLVMFEKVSMYHPDKVADRIAGALVDLAYSKKQDPKVAVEVLIGHGKCLIINETDTPLDYDVVKAIVCRMLQSIDIDVEYKEVKQDAELARNQADELRCGDNGIFKSVLPNREEMALSELTHRLDQAFPSDGKYILDRRSHALVICQSNASDKDIFSFITSLHDLNFDLTINPLGYWIGGTNVDCGATNRKLGSDMGRSATGGGLHGKDLSKGDVSINIECMLLTDKKNIRVEAYCAIGDKEVVFYANTNRKKILAKKSFAEIVADAKRYINKIGGFEKLAEYGLIRY
jgi:S-adenosylmethionine synthetase